MSDETANTPAYNSPYKFNGKELDEGTGMYYYGARYYDPRISVWMSVDPLAENAAKYSPYIYCFNNPLTLFDPDGQWPGVTSFFFQGNIGAGIGFGLYAVQQSGIAYDDYGKTHFIMTGTAYFVNQNLQDGSQNPNFVLGADMGLSAGFSHDWNSRSFVESVSQENQISNPGPNIKGSLGLGFAGNKNSFGMTIGFQAGVTVNTMGMLVTESISLTRDEASRVKKMTDVNTESWFVRDIRANKNRNNEIQDYSGSIYTKDTKGKLINSGINVKCGGMYKNNRISPDNKWISPAYQKGLDEDK